jgi:dipeptidyl aminopeptidase/acylaminoacyl peptidase
MRRAKLRGLAAAGVCLAALVGLLVAALHSRRSPIPLLPSDPSQWERVDISDLPEVAAFSLVDLIDAPSQPVPRKFALEGELEPGKGDDFDVIGYTIEIGHSSAPPNLDYLDVTWSKGGRRIAVASSGEDEDVIEMLDVDTGERRRVELGAHVDTLTFDWHPSGKRFLVGTFDKAGWVAVEELVPAERLTEYDVNSLEAVREFTSQDLGASPNWARYSPDGDKILITVEAHDASLIPENIIGSVGDGAASRATLVAALLGNADSRATLLIDAEGRIRTIASGDDSFSCPQWNHNGTALLHGFWGDNWDSPLAFLTGEHEWEDIHYYPLDSAQESRVLDSVPGGCSGLVCYPDRGGLVRYEAEEYNDNLLTSKWEVWEYALQTGKREFVLDLKAFLSATADMDMGRTTFSFLPGNKDLCFVWEGARQSHETDSYWYLSLGPRRVLGRLDLDYSRVDCFYPSPDGRRLAYLDTDLTIRILDMSGVLEAIGGVVE